MWRATSGIRAAQSLIHSAGLFWHRCAVTQRGNKKQIKIFRLISCMSESLINGRTLHCCLNTCCSSRVISAHYYMPVNQRCLNSPYLQSGPYSVSLYALPTFPLKSQHGAWELGEKYVGFTISKMIKWSTACWQIVCTSSTVRDPPLSTI